MTEGELDKVSSVVEKMVDCKKCPIFCDWASAKKCKDYIKEYLEKKLKE